MLLYILSSAISILGLYEQRSLNRVLFSVRLHRLKSSMTSSFTFRGIMDVWYSRVDDVAVIVPSLSELRTKLLLENVNSCVAFGCGHGTMELLYLEYCMPNISQFIAVEPDHESAEVLKTKLAERLPNVRSVVFQKTIQQWQGVNQPVDAVLLFHVLYHLNLQERMALYHRLFDTTLHSGSHVFILIHPLHNSGEPSAYCRIIQQLKSLTQTITDREVIDAMLSIGFELSYERMYHCRLNVEEPDDAFLSLFLVADDIGSSLESVRLAAKKVFGDSKQVRHDVWLGVFRKP